MKLPSSLLVFWREVSKMFIIFVFLLQCRAAIMSFTQNVHYRHCHHHVTTVLFFFFNTNSHDQTEARKTKKKSGTLYSLIVSDVIVQCFYLGMMQTWANISL